MKEKVQSLITVNNLSFLFSIFSFILAICSFLNNSDLVIISIFIIVFTSNFVLYSIIIWQKRKIKENGDSLKICEESFKNLESECIESFFDDTIFDVVRQLRDIEGTIYAAYSEYYSRVIELEETLSKDLENKEKIIQSLDKELVDYYQLMRNNQNNFFKFIVKNLKKTIDFHFKKMGYNENVSVCIKQLNKPYSSKDNRIGDLKVFSVYRDEDSYRKDMRKTGEMYSVVKNSTFLHCINDHHNDRNVMFIQNNIERALSTEAMEMENKNYRKFYNATAITPILKPRSTEILYYGFLAIDSLNNSVNDHLFDYKHLDGIMNTYAAFLGQFYHFTDMYVEDLFTNIYEEFLHDEENEQKKELKKSNEITKYRKKGSKKC